MSSPSLELEPLGTSSYTPEQVLTALNALALNGGHIELARKTLHAQGHDVSRATLYRWRTETYPERYRQVCDQLAPQVEAHVIELQRSLAVQATQTAIQAVELEQRRLRGGKVKDAAASARNLATVAGISVDKILSLSGRPTSVIEHRTVDDDLRALRAAGIVNGTAEEVTDAQPA